MVMKCKVLQLEVTGIVTEYNKPIWVDEDGGYFKDNMVKYDVPRIGINFVGEVEDMVLRPGSVYFDGINHFRATNEKTIVNAHKDVDVFNVPKELIEIANVYAE